MMDTGGGSAGLYTELLPAGCAPDAYKLFVGNVPKAFTEEELRPVRCSSSSSTTKQASKQPDGIWCWLAYGWQLHVKKPSCLTLFVVFDP